MITIESLDKISDGKIYEINDMVKADAGGCDHCSACCQGVGELLALTPYDVYRIGRSLDTSFAVLEKEYFDMRPHGKLDLPHLRMVGHEEQCVFLDAKGSCSIHDHRPGICRLFPLGRVYLDDDIKYFLQVGACTKPQLGKIKVKKWIGIQDYNQNKAFVLAWHQVLKALEFRLKFVRDPEAIQAINQKLVDAFFDLQGTEDQDFYDGFFKILPEIKNQLGII